MDTPHQVEDIYTFLQIQFQKLSLFLFSFHDLNNIKKEVVLFNLKFHNFKVLMPYD